MEDDTTLVESPGGLLEDFDLPLELPKAKSKKSVIIRRCVIVVAVLLVLFLVIAGIVAVVFSIVWAIPSSDDDNSKPHHSTTPSVTPSAGAQLISPSPSPSPTYDGPLLPRFSFLWGTIHGNYQRTGFSGLTNDSTNPTWRTEINATVFDILPSSFGVLIATSAAALTTIDATTGNILSSVSYLEASLQNYQSTITTQLPNENFDLVISMDALCRIGYFYATETGTEFQFSFPTPGVSIGSGHTFPYCNYIVLDKSGFNVLVHFNIESSLILFDIETQTLIWKSNTAVSMLNTQVTFLNNSILAFARTSTTYGVASLNSTTGRINWLTTINATRFSVGATDIDNERFYFQGLCENTTCAPTVYCVNATSGGIIWHNESNSTFVASLETPVILTNPRSYPDYNHIILVTVNADLYCYSPYGDILWVQNEASTIAGLTKTNEILVLNGKIFYENGTWISPMGTSFSIPSYSRQMIDNSNNLFISTSDFVYATHLASV